MRNDPDARFIHELLIDAQLVDPDPPRPSADPTGSFQSSPAARSALPWHWPPGSRRLLAGLVMTAAVAISLSGTARSTSDERQAVPVLVLDANSAPARVLGALPHVGPALVRHWTAAREARPFDSLEDMEKRVRGLGPVSMARIASHVRIENDPKSGAKPDGNADTIP